MLLGLAIELIGLDLLLLLVKLLLTPYEGGIKLLAPAEPGSSLSLKLLKKSGCFGWDKNKGSIVFATFKLSKGSL